MKKLLSLVCIFTAIACQLAHARSYRYERVGHDQPEYLQYGGARYARVLQEEDIIEVQPVQRRYAEPKYSQRRYYEPVEYKEKFTPLAVDARPYVGLDVGSSSVKLGKIKNRYDLENSDIQLEDVFDKQNINFTGVVGVQINPTIAVELFYQQAMDNEKKTFELKTDFLESKVTNKLSYSAFGVDFIGMHPLSETLDVLFGLGLAQYNFEGKFSQKLYNYTVDYRTSINEAEKEDVFAARLGIGLQYMLTDHVALRAMGRYIHMFDDEVVRRMMELSLGVRYLF